MFDKMSKKKVFSHPSINTIYCILEFSPAVRDMLAEILDTVPNITEYLDEKVVEELPHDYRKQLANQAAALAAIPLKVVGHSASGDELHEQMFSKLPGKRALKNYLNALEGVIEGDDWAPPAKETVKARINQIIDE